jgi:hypothetical protein
MRFESGGWREVDTFGDWLYRSEELGNKEDK